MKRRGLRFVPWENIFSGGVGSIVQLFRLRDVFAQRIYGPATGQLKQSEYNASLETSLADRARHTAGNYRLDDETRFQERAFEDFIRRCQASKERVVILRGQMNPLFENALNPEIRARMISFLRDLAKRYSNMTLIEDLPPQSANDYEDLTHVTKTTQERFTSYLAEWIRGAAASEVTN